MDSTKNIDNGADVLVAELTGLEMLNGVKLQLAQQYAPRRWRSWVEKVLNELKQGRSLDTAINRHRQWAPNELGELIDSSLKVGDPAQLILDALRARESFRSSWREFITLLLYPTVTLVFAIMIGVMFSRVVDLNFVREFGLRGGDQAVATVNDQRQSLYGLAFVVGWTMLILATIALVGPAWAFNSVVGGVRVFGRPLRWINLGEILHRYQLFIGQGLATVDAAEAVSLSFSASSQRYVATGIENRIRQGTALGESLAATPLSDSLCRPALLMLDYRGSDLPAALVETSLLLQHLVDQRCRSLSGIMPLIVLLLAGSIVWSIFSCYLMVFILLGSMITSLA